MHIQNGNAFTDGSNFNQWIIGDLETWCAQQGIEYDPVGMALHNTQQVEIKWGFHPKSQERPGGWARPSDSVTLSLLVRGDFLLKFRFPQDPIQETKLHMKGEGDYVIWREIVEHTWQAQADSVVLTVRWKADEGKSS